MPPAVSISLPSALSSLTIPLTVNDKQNQLLEIKSPEPLSKIKIHVRCPDQHIIINTGRDSVPVIHSIADANQLGRIYKSGDVVVDMMRPEIDLRYLLQMRSLHGSINKAQLIVEYSQAKIDASLVILPPAANIKSRMMFTYRFSPADNESRTIPIVLDPGYVVTQPFYLEPIRDQGGILFIDITVSRLSTGSLVSNQTGKNDSLYICIDDRGFTTSQDLIEAVVGSRQCKGSHLLLSGPLPSVANHSFYYPRWGWWYVNTVVISSDSNTKWKLELAISSERCKRAIVPCSGHGVCLLSAIDNGLLSSCHCYRPYYGLGCDLKRSADQDKMQYMQYKRRWLLFSNLAFIPAIVVASLQKLFLLSLVYSATMGFSMVYHSSSNDDLDIHSSILPLEQLAYYDHFAAAFCIWVSFVTMSTLSSKIQSIFSVTMVFALIVMAHSVQRSVWMYAVPVIGGIGLLVICWAWRMYHLKCIFPPIDWWMFGLIPGFSLVVAGFIFFRLSVYEDYEYFLYHSVWHILIALAICFILPNTRRWNKALKKTPSGDAISEAGNTHIRRCRKFKKKINYYLHLDILIDYLILHNPRCSFLKSY